MKGRKGRGREVEEGREGKGREGKGMEEGEGIGAPYDFLPPGATDLVTPLGLLLEI